MKMYRLHRLYPRNSKPKEPSLYRSLCVSILCMFLSTVMLVGTTFAWFHSSATSAVSTITAASQFKTTQAISQDTIRLAVSSASAVALYDSDNASETDISLDDLPWSPFTSNSGSPFSSVPFSPGDSQVIFLRLDNTGSSDSTYRLALNLLSEAPGKTADGQEVPVSEKLVYGYEVLDAADLFELASFNPADRTNLDDTVTTNFVADPLSAHSGERNEDIITYGGNICSVTLSAGTVKYVAIALYMPENVELPNFVALPTIAVQLAMTVEQANTTEQQQPNVVISPISNSTVVEIKQAIIGQPSENEVSKDSAEEANKEPVDGTKTGEETSDNGTTDQPAPGGTETPASPDPSSGSTGESGTPSGASDTGTTSDTDTTGGIETAATEPTT
ncbi:MAG: hypothetical protein J6I99_03355 [Oscillospiraceae bacterium]|nr:hypothetical protein [Oscillospiraceae bacterium]